MCHLLESSKVTHVYLGQPSPLSAFEAQVHRLTDVLWALVFIFEPFSWLSDAWVFHTGFWNPAGDSLPELSVVTLKVLAIGGLFLPPTFFRFP